MKALILASLVTLATACSGPAAGSVAPIASSVPSAALTLAPSASIDPSAAFSAAACAALLRAADASDIVNRIVVAVQASDVPAIALEGQNLIDVADDTDAAMAHAPDWAPGKALAGAILQSVASARAAGEAFVASAQTGNGDKAITALGKAAEDLAAAEAASAELAAAGDFSCG